MTPVILPQNPIGCGCPNCVEGAGSLSLAQSWPGGIDDHYQCVYLSSHSCIRFRVD